MAIRADRDVLYLRKFQCDKYTSQANDNGVLLYRKYHGDRGCPCPLFGGGSLTVEAAFCGTLFFLALFSLLYLFRLVEGYNDIQLQLATAVRQYECYGVKKRVIQDERRHLYRVGWDEKTGICYVRHREEIPYLGGSFFHISWHQQMKINDYKGRSMAGHGDEKGEYVYLADHGTVYHRNTNCVYLKPDIRQTTFRQLEAQRNISGGRYAPCRRCGRSAEPSDGTSIFITPYGDSWDTRKDCSGLKRSARRVPIEEVGGLPPCSKCGGGDK